MLRHSCEVVLYDKSPLLAVRANWYLGSRESEYLRAAHCRLGRACTSRRTPCAARPRPRRHSGSGGRRCDGDASGVHVKTANPAAAWRQGQGVCQTDSHAIPASICHLASTLTILRWPWHLQNRSSIRANSVPMPSSVDSLSGMNARTIVRRVMPALDSERDSIRAFRTRNQGKRTPPAAAQPCGLRLRRWSMVERNSSSTATSRAS